MLERGRREYFSRSQEPRRKHSVQRQPLGPRFFPHPSPYPRLSSASHLDTVNKSLTPSRLFCFPVLWSLLRYTLCQFTQQLSVTAYAWLQYPDDHLKHSSSLLVSPSRILKLTQRQTIFFPFFLTFFFFFLNGDKLFLNTGSFSALIHAAWEKQVIYIFNWTVLKLC